MIVGDALLSSASGKPVYFARFGLNREPFSEAVENDFFYSEADQSERLGLSRLQRLNLLLHLAPYSDVLLVTGGVGIGKTTLLHQFLAKADPSWRVCAVNARPEVTNQVVLQSLARELAKDYSGHSDEASQIEGLRDHIRALRESTQTPILIIDDAHHLGEAVLKLLLRLVQADAGGDNKLLSVILFSEPSLETKLTQPELIPLRNLISHSFELTSFNEEDTANYIKHRLKVAGLTSESPFTPAVVKVIHGTSHGIPARINELAQVVLNNSAAMEPAGLSFTMPPRAEWLKRYGLAGVLAALVIAAVVFQDEINSIFVADTPSDTNRVAVKSEQPEAISVPSSSNTAIQPASQDMPPVEATNSEPVPSAEITPQPVEASADGEPAVGMVARVDTSSSLSTATEEGDDETGINLDDQSGDLDSLPDESAELDDLESDVTVADEPEEIPVATVEEVVKGPEQQVNAVEDAKAPAVSKVPAPAPKDSQTNDVTVVDKQNNAIHREDWLLSQDPRHYTLQLMAIREDATIVKFIKDNNLQDQAAYFSTQNNGKEWLAVVYGIYPTRADAAAASKQLSKTLISITPWTRSIASIHESISTYRASQ